MSEDQNSPSCPVCMNYMIKSVKTECNHEFCVKCLFKWMFECLDEREKIDCPLCRQIVWIGRLKWKKAEEIKDVAVETK